MLKHVKGNLIDMAEAGQFDIIVHGCNCQNTMGSGIAKELKTRYPGVYVADTKATSYYFNPIFKLGNFSMSIHMVNDHCFEVVNAYTQLHYLPRGIDHFEYESFGLILRKLAAIYPDKRFGFPYIGMGLAGGDPEIITEMLEVFSDTVDTTLVEFG